MALQYPFHRNPHFGTHIVALPPVGAAVAAHSRDQLGSDHAKLVVAHDLSRATVLREGIVESPFCRCQAVLGFFLQVLRDLDQLLQHLDRVDAAVVIARYGLHQTREKRLLSGACWSLPFRSECANRNAARRLRSDLELYRTC